MTVQLDLSSIFARYTDNQLSLKLEGNTIGECLNDLVTRYPDLKKMLLDGNGRLRHSYDIYINGESAYPREMTRPVKDGDKLNLIMLIQGG
jgi:molybdopterin converting factor small subunit